MSSQQNNLPPEVVTDTSSHLVSSFSNTITPNFTFETLINNFHFIRPMWLLAFFALFLVLFILKRMRYYQSPWQHFLPPHLSSALLENTDKNTENSASTSPNFWLKPFIIGSFIIIALAGPAWQKLPQPVYQLERGAVLIMDMSYSMYATDVKPNRLTRSRYKAIDLLNKVNEGDVGLIAYAGDAFIISPLTQDVKNLELLLPSLSPDIMPVPGANALAALTLANQTLQNAGHLSGDIYWFTDDIDNDELSDIYQWANKNSHRINILGVGSKEGAPIKLSNGQLLKDSRGAIVVPKLPESRLSGIAQRGRGLYRTMTNDDSDIKALTEHLTSTIENEIDELNGQETQKQDEQTMKGDQYQEQGPWLLLVIIPFILTYFRRGSSILSITWLLPLSFIISFIGVSPSSYANNTSQASQSVSSDQQTAVDSNTVTKKDDGIVKFWNDLWQTPDQQGQKHYQQDQFQQAANQFDDTQWKGSAHYKAGEFEEALAAFKQSDSAQSLYNQGNSLAQLQKIDEAIDAYKEALIKDPSLTDAQDNLEQLEAIKKQQEQQKQENGDGEDNKDDQEGEQQEGDQNNKDSQESSDSDQQEQNKQQGDQEKSDNSQSSEQDEQTEQENKSAEQQAQENKEKQDAEEAARAKEPKEEAKEPGEDKTLAQREADSKKQETQQKHQQLLNKVTDDPYLLLRNKMRLEYQKRRQDGATRGDTKKW